jgi:hypothetical protein
MATGVAVIRESLHFPRAVSMHAQMRPLRKGGAEAAQVREENNPRKGAVSP